MPQLFNDEAIITAMESAGYAHEDAMDYALVGCVELSAPGNSLGFSDAAMFNMVKALELTLNDGVCMRTGRQLGIKRGLLTDFETYEAFEAAYRDQLDFFVGKMEPGLQIIERFHRECLPSPMLSSVIGDCLERGVDVTAGGARYNMSGIQLIQAANRKYIGVSNELILDNFQFLARNAQALLVRVPLIPRITAEEGNLRTIARFVRGCGENIPIEPLNYNYLAGSKYGLLGHCAGSIYILLAKVNKEKTYAQL